MIVSFAGKLKEMVLLSLNHNNWLPNDIQKLIQTEGLNQELVLQNAYNKKKTIQLSWMVFRLWFHRSW